MNIPQLRVQWEIKTIYKRTNIRGLVMKIRRAVCAGTHFIKTWKKEGPRPCSTDMTTAVSMAYAINTIIYGYTFDPWIIQGLNVPVN